MDESAGGVKQRISMIIQGDSKFTIQTYSVNTEHRNNHLLVRNVWAQVTTATSTMPHH